MKPYLISLLLLASALLQASDRPPVVHHRLEVAADPHGSTLRVEDRITLPEKAVHLEFVLHGGLRIELQSPAGRLINLGPVQAAVPASRYRIELERPSRTLTLSWSGRISHPPRDRQQRGGGTPGTISSEGIYLAGSSLWYPWMANRLVTFTMRLELPEEWHGMSQGAPLAEATGWKETSPQDDIYLVAAPYHRYEHRFGGITAMVWLREPDEALARRYLQVTGHYIALYERLIGPYPYAKFALVENFWESGYGMPSFTLLGPRVTRLPFILHSSYPHEILHNWWGNGVYVDYETGNWSEGLTSYLADHLIREQQGKGAAYRRDILLKYANWVKEGRDLPLVEFRSRHGESSEAAGYGRMLMFMHGLRLQLGDQLFLSGLRRFYKDNLFRIAGFDDLKLAFEAVSGERLDGLFRQWTRRTGAPDLRLEAVVSSRDGHGYRVRGRLRQVQPQAPFRLRVPLYLRAEGEDAPRLHWLEMRERELEFEFRLETRPLRLQVDPLYDLFRRLHPDEVPATLSALFAAEGLDLILPDQAPEPYRKAYLKLARQWQKRFPGVRIRWDEALEELPEGKAVWILGRENRFAGKVLEPLRKPGVEVSEEALLLGGRPHPLKGKSLVLTSRGPAPRGLLVLGSPGAADTLARKLPHYGKYSYLLFEGDEATNRLKGQWPTRAAGLSATLASSGTLPPMTVPDHPPLSESLTGQQNQASR